MLAIGKVEAVKKEEIIMGVECIKCCFKVIKIFIYSKVRLSFYHYLDNSNESMSCRIDYWVEILRLSKFLIQI